MTTKKNCLIEDCCDPSYSKGYCKKHYTRLVRNGNPLTRKNFAFKSIGEKLSRYLVSPSGCWEWTAGLNSQGYGTLYCNGKKRYAHRTSFAYHNNMILPDDVLVLHKCDNRKCINPNHLFTGNHLDNMQDAKQKDRLRKGEERSKLSEETIRQIKIMHSSGVRQRDIIKRFGLCQSTVSAITTGRIWGWLNL